MTEKQPNTKIKLDKMLEDLTLYIYVMSENLETLQNELQKIELFNKDLSKEWDRIKHYYYEPFIDSVQKVIDTWDDDID